MGLYLALLIAAVAIPAALIFGLLVYNLYQQDRMAHERQLFSASHIMMTAVDADLGQGWVLLHALDKSESLKRKDWRAFDAEARRTAAPGTGIALISPTGHFLVYTRFPYGTQMPDYPTRLFAPRWLELTRQGETISDEIQSPILHKSIVALDLLTHDGAGGTYSLALSLDTANLDRLLAEQHLPPGWVAGLLDNHGRQIARSPARDEGKASPRRRT